MVAKVAYDILFRRLQWRGLSKNHHGSKKKSNGAGILHGYGVYDGYDDDMDDDDEERSRGIPSRTGIGKRGSIIEKFPGLGNPLTLFGGLITIPFWGYLNTPVAYLDVMLADLPHIQYNYKKTATKQQEEDMLLVARKMKEDVGKKGLLGASKIKLDKVVDGNALLEELKK